MLYCKGNSNWRDQLSAVNGVGISYDNIGNPRNDGTWSYTWEKGRQLKNIFKSDKYVSFKYNENGLRIQKNVNGVNTNYTLHGKNIVHMTQGSSSMHFFYDTNNKPAIVEYNGTKYAYVHNLQGDIVTILDSNGAAVVQYKYDAWGKPIGKTGSMASTLGMVQPFRYRGYVYDEETGMYYLRSRYYSPFVNRFLNVDHLGMLWIVDGDIGDYNLLSYCRSNPITCFDPHGFAATICLSHDGSSIHRDQTSFANGGGGAALALVGALAAAAIISEANKRKPPNLPARKKLSVDVEHITSGHMPNGNRNPNGNKTIFWGLTVEQMLRAIDEAYDVCSKLQTQGDHIKY